jgi:cell division protein FtsL
MFRSKIKTDGKENTKSKGDKMMYAIFIVAMFITPYAILKAIEMYQIHKNKDWR